MNASLSDTRPRVFLTQEVSSFDYRPAEKFGDLIPLTNQEVSNIADSMANRELAAVMAQKLLHFDPERDYICFSGSPSVAALAFMLIGSRHKFMRLLKFVARDQQYVVQTIRIP